MATLAEIKLIEIVFIRYDLVIVNYKVNGLNFNVFFQKILILIVSSSKSRKKQLKHGLGNPLYVYIL
jgi:hypothetical protein